MRAPLGYARFYTAAQTRAINQLYDMMWLFYNFFSHRDTIVQPVMCVMEKIIVSADGQSTRVKRRYD